MINFGRIKNLCLIRADKTLLNKFHLIYTDILIQKLLYMHGAGVYYNLSGTDV
jgi:hypothetical protein